MYLKLISRYCIACVFVAVELFKLETSCTKNIMNYLEFYVRSNIDRREWVRKIKKESDAILYLKWQKWTRAHG